MLRLVEVAAAIMLADDRVLLAKRRSEGRFPGFWEFPGGKVEPGETSRQAIRREVQEELGLEQLETAFDFFMEESIVYNNSQYRIAFFCCRLDHRVTTSSDHEDLRYCNRGDLASLLKGNEPIMEADLGPINHLLENWSAIFSK